MKYILLSLLAILSFLSLVSPVQAAANNKFGIHISNSGDLSRATELVNSSGGDWGYITVVIQDNDLNQEKWQNFFNICRQNHLIPLVRIATHPDGNIWVKPKKEFLKNWADFFESLNWPIKIRYLIIYNEPNQAKEWGGEINPEEYSQILNEALYVFKQKSEDFFILNAGFDQAAPNSKTTMDEFNFLQKMNKEIPGIFSKIDGWASHSYPNNGFIGKPFGTGKASIKGYDWELKVIKSNFNLSKTLPVFITETGWPHTLNTTVWVTSPKYKYKKVEKSINYDNYYNESTSAQYLKKTFEEIWLKDERVIAITPFILNYPYSPFENFSWLDKEGNPKLIFETIKKINKNKGEPPQDELFEVLDFSYPPFLPQYSVFSGKITLKNIGQSIWGEKVFSLKSISQLKLTDLILPEGMLIKPQEKYTFDYLLNVENNKGEQTFTWEKIKENKITIFEVWKLTNEKDTLFNRIYNKIANFIYGL